MTRKSAFACVLIAAGITVALGASHWTESSDLSASDPQLGPDAGPLTSTYVSTYEVLAEYPHDPESFTQGLAFDPSGRLYESDGLYRNSAVREVDVRTGRHTVRTANDRDHFAEGIEAVDGKLLQLTWQNKVLNEFSLPGLAHLRTVPMAVGQEGWGLTSDGEKLFLTDSTDALYHLDKRTYAELAKLSITDPKLRPSHHYKDTPIYGANELEMVRGELWANVYPMYQNAHSECVARINPSTGVVIGWVDLTGLFARQRSDVRQQPMNYVLNGIAYHNATNRLYVTGKKWDKMYHIAVKPAPELGAEHVRKACNLGAHITSVSLADRSGG